MPRLRANSLLAIAAACLLASCGQEEESPSPDSGAQEPLGLFTSLPIYWNEGEDIAAMLDPQAQQPSWVREALEDDALLVPLDTLEAEALAPLDLVLLAQPRALAPSENVALDSWVRAGGRALILADPFLTQHSDFALGDPRRPFDVVLISPILTRWGLELRFDDGQPQGERQAQLGGAALPVDLAGSFVTVAGGEQAACELMGDGLLAQCEIGQGRVVLLADAALVDTEHDTPERRAALANLLQRLRDK